METGGQKIRDRRFSQTPKFRVGRWTTLRLGHVCADLLVLRAGLAHGPQLLFERFRDPGTLIPQDTRD